MSKLIILDRDGVINQDSDDYIKSADEWIPIPGSIEAIARLSQAGYILAVATNQSGLARGYFDQKALDAMHAKMLRSVENVGGEIDGIFYCPHHPDDKCECRKPKPGLIDQIAERLNIDVEGAFFIGDSCSDLLAADSRKCTPLLVRTGKGERTLANLPAGIEPLVFDDLRAAAQYILEASNPAL